MGGELSLLSLMRFTVAGRPSSKGQDESVAYQSNSPAVALVGWIRSCMTRFRGTKIWGNGLS